MRGILSFIFAMAFMVFPDVIWADLAAPVLQFPASGEKIQLINNSTELQLRWSRVADATAYSLDVSGPSGFGSFNNAMVEQESSNPFVTFPINQLVAGDYVWSVSAINTTMVGAATASSFTILSGTVGGGDLIPPTLLFPPNFAFAKVASSQVTFRWAPVVGATEYLLQLPGAFPGPIPVREGKTEIRVQLIPQGSRIYPWNVTAVNDEQEGEVSGNRQILLTRHEWEPTEIAYRLASDWFRLGSVLNVHPDPPSPQGEPITNHYEGIELIPYQRDAKPSSIFGQTGPTPVSPGPGSEVPLVDSNSDLLVDTPFEWQFPNSVGYEFQLLDAEKNLIVSHLLPHPLSGDNPFTRISRTVGTGEFCWRVRALRNGGSDATPYSAYQSFTIILPDLN